MLSGAKPRIPRNDIMLLRERSRRGNTPDIILLPERRRAHTTEQRTIMAAQQRGMGFEKSNRRVSVLNIDTREVGQMRLKTV